MIHDGIIIIALEINVRNIIKKMFNYNIINI